MIDPGLFGAMAPEITENAPATSPVSAPIEASEAQTAANAFFAEAENTLLDEVVLETMKVRFVEWVEQDYTTGEGKKAKRMRPQPRTAEIESFCPMEALHLMMKRQQEVAAAQAAGTPDPEKALTMMEECVLMCWRYSEPDMTLQRLVKGLDRKKITALFYHFFKAELRATSTPQA